MNNYLQGCAGFDERNHQPGKIEGSDRKLRFDKKKHFPQN